MPYDPNYWDPFEEDPQEAQRKWREELARRDNQLPCSLQQALMLVIPPEGIIIPCQAHPKGHFLIPNTISYTSCQQT